MIKDKGFLIFAQNSMRDVYYNYLEMAYALSLSILVTQKEKNIVVAVTPGETIPEKYKLVFRSFDIPWGDLAQNSENKFENEWKAPYITPFKKTIKLEADMLLTDSIDHWWDILDGNEVAFTTKIYDYRNQLIDPGNTRKFFKNNDLPNVYNGCMYFEKETETCLEFFKIAEHIFKGWERFSYEHLDYTRPLLPDTDTVYALAAKLCQRQISMPDVLRFIHMKFELMDWKLNFKEENWSSNSYICFDDKMNLYINGFKQTLPFHYHEKSFLTQHIIKKYEKHLGI